jgi:hypothetical protein
MENYDYYEEKIKDLSTLLKQRIGIMRILVNDKRHQQQPFARIEDKIELLEDIVEALEIE